MNKFRNNLKKKKQKQNKTKKKEARRTTSKNGGPMQIEPRPDNGVKLQRKMTEIRDTNTAQDRLENRVGSKVYEAGRTGKKDAWIASMTKQKTNSNSWLQLPPTSETSTLDDVPFQVPGWNQASARPTKRMGEETRSG